MDEPIHSVITHDREVELWRAARLHKDSSARLALIDHYSFVARRIAARFYKNRPDDDVEFGDYLQYAMVGLIESIDRYDPEKEAAFATFAGYRIKGAVLNGLQKCTERREQWAYRARFQRDRIDSIAENVNNLPKNKIFAEMVDVAIELALSYMLEDSGLITRQELELNDNTYNGLVLTELNSQLYTMVAALPDREKFIITNHYFHHVGFDELGKLLGVTKGRVSQLHKRALQLIKAHFDTSSELDDYY